MAAANTTTAFEDVLSRLLHEGQIAKPLLPTYAHLIISALFPIYIAAHASLTRPNSAAKPAKKARTTADDHEVETVRKVESLTPTDAILFPLLAGCTLASLYFLLKWLQDPAWLNWALGIYFSHIGLFFAYKFLKDAFTTIRSITFPASYSTGGAPWTASSSSMSYSSSSGQTCPSPLPGLLGYIRLPNSISNALWKLRRTLHARASLNIHIRSLLTYRTPITILDPLAFFTALSIILFNTFISKPWYITNFLGFSFCYGALQFTTPTTGWTGTLVLAALFVYDIYFVFFTPMMVTVATKLDVPIKLLFPRPDGCVVPIGAAEGSEEMAKYLECIAKKRTMAMLGLGDIVLPGMMIAFALRFDLYLHYLRKQSKNGKGKQPVKAEHLAATGGWGERFWTAGGLQDDKLTAKRFKKTYFNATIVGYILGMVTTVVVMQVAEHAQPALLYLVPGVLGAFWGTALFRGELNTLWRYTEEDAGGSKSKSTSKDLKSKADNQTKNAGSEANGVLPEDSSSRHQQSESSSATSDSDTSSGYPNATKSDKSPSSKSKTPAKPSPTLFEFSITLLEEPGARPDNQKSKSVGARQSKQIEDTPKSKYNLRSSSVGVQEEDGNAEMASTVKCRRKA